MMDENGQVVEPQTITELIDMIESAWGRLITYIDSLPEQAWHKGEDAGGWRVKDHLVHLHIWEMGLLGLLQGRGFGTAMGVDASTWAAGDMDAINAVIWRRCHSWPIQRIRESLTDGHIRLIACLRQQTLADLSQPFVDGVAESDEPLLDWVWGSTAEHYLEHLAWIAVIVANA